MGNKTIFEKETEMMLRHTDAARVLFFPRLYDMAHEAVETLLSQIGFPISDMISGKLHPLPVVHSEADYMVPFRLGDKLMVKVSLHKVGERSVGFTCDFVDQDGKTRAVTRVDHAAIDPDTGKTTELKAELKAVLLELQG